VDFVVLSAPIKISGANSDYRLSVNTYLRMFKQEEPQFGRKYCRIQINSSVTHHGGDVSKYGSCHRSRGPTDDRVENSAKNAENSPKNSRGGPRCSKPSNDAGNDTDQHCMNDLFIKDVW